MKRPCKFPGCRNDDSKGSGGYCGAHPTHKLTEQQVLDIRRLDDRTMALRQQLAGRYEVSIHAIIDAALRRTWRHI